MVSVVDLLLASVYSGIKRQTTVLSLYPSICLSLSLSHVLSVNYYLVFLFCHFALSSYFTLGARDAKQSRIMTENSQPLETSSFGICQLTYSLQRYNGAKYRTTVSKTKFLDA